MNNQAMAEDARIAVKASRKREHDYRAWQREAVAKGYNERAKRYAKNVNDCREYTRFMIRQVRINQAIADRQVSPRYMEVAE